MQTLRVSDQWIELQNKLIEDRRERFRTVGIDPGWDHNPGAAHVKRAQRGLIAKLESRGSSASILQRATNSGEPDPW